MKIGSAVFALLAFLWAGSVSGADTEFAWQDHGKYRAPDFEGTFPLDPDASGRLEMAVPTLERREPVGENVFELIRKGLRGLRVDRQMPALRGFGNSFIWGRSPQDPRAIELMYHASASTNSQISYNAIYFGLSTVRPMTDSILRALVEAGMRSEDPNVLSRIAWGTSAWKEKLLRQLQPYLESSDLQRQRHAEALRQIFSGEVEAFAWAEARAKELAREKYSSQLEEIRGVLLDGDSVKRRQTLKLIQRERISLIMDESFISAFAAAARDRDAKVRDLATVTTGGQWIWSGRTRTNQAPEAIQLMMHLSHDSDRQVRYNAMYYGLSTIRNRSDEVVDRMIQMLMEDGLDNGNFRERITWGLRDERPTVQRVIEKWMDGADRIKALFAYGFFLDFFGEKPPENAIVKGLLQTPEEPVCQILAFGSTAGWKPTSMEEYLDTLRAEIPANEVQHVLWTHSKGPPFAIVETQDAAAIKSALLKSPHFKIAFERPLSVAAIVTIGKEGGFKALDLKQ